MNEENGKEFAVLMMDQENVGHIVQYIRSLTKFNESFINIDLSEKIEK